MAQPPRLIRAFATVGLWTMLSRVLGFAREIAIAATLGAGPVAEAFFVAFSLPNLFRRFFAEGAFNLAFVPMFAKKLEAGEDALPFARDALTGLATILIVLTLAAQVAMPALVLAMASGFAADERLDLATHYGRIAFPYILLISMAALLSGVLNAAGRFVAAAAAPTLLNVVFLIAIWIALRQQWAVGEALAWAVPVAGVAQFAVVWVAAARAGFVLMPRRPRLTPELRRLAVIAAPAVVAGGVVQINLLVGRQVASYFDGAIAWLAYADRLYQLPLGVVGIAIGVVLLPDLSRRLRAGDEAGSAHALSRAAEFAMLLTLPCAVALAVVPLPLVTGVFERGTFTADDSAATATALALYALGLPAFVMQKLWQPLYYAREDTRAPLRYAVVAMGLNAALAIGLAPAAGYLAAPLATTVSAWAMLVLLRRGARGMGPAAVLDARYLGRRWRIALASAGMGAVLWVLNLALAPVWAAAPVLGLAALVGGGMAAYALLAAALGAMRPADLRAGLRRG